MTYAMGISNADILARPYASIGNVDRDHADMIDSTGLEAALLRIAGDPAEPAVLRGQALAALDTLNAVPGTSASRSDGTELTLAQSRRSPTGASNLKVVTTETKPNCNLFGQCRPETIKTTEIKAGGAKWYSETTNVKGEYSASMVMLMNNGTSKGNFGDHGCHATALLNTINTAARTDLKPENARDAGSNYSGTVKVGIPFFEKNQTVYQQLGKSEVDFNRSKDAFWSAANKVNFVDLSLPKGAKMSNVDRDLLFRPDEFRRQQIEKGAANSKTIKMDANLEARILANVKAGVPVVIGAVGSPRHSAVITGFERSDKPGSKDILVVRDNWQSENDEAKRMTFDAFQTRYGKEYDFVWAAQPRTK